jgi:2-amino-4-hydroxy-6-hydroxymethyldihydropteridine diphosphokinase
LREAVRLLDETEGVAVVASSSLRETDPVGVLEQPRFLNGAVALDTELAPRDLLAVLLEIERRLGRVRGGARWGPRAIDLDLLVHGDEVVDEPGLHVPHPRLSERRFVLEPLAELDPGLFVPGAGKVSKLLAALDA